MPSDKKEVVAKFIPPQCGKSWSFQIVFLNNKLPETWEFINLFAEDDVKAAYPFLQGHSGNWAMVEFWVKEEAIARKAAEKFATHFNVEMGEGDFTRAEIGLE